MFMRLFTRTPAIPEIKSVSLDTERLDSSLKLLQTTTAELSETAANTAAVLHERLLDAEYRFYSTIDAVDDLVLVKDGAGIWKVLNSAGQEIFGMHNREYAGQTDMSLCEKFPNLRTLLTQCTETDELAWIERKPHRTEEQVPYRDRIRYFDVIKHPVFHKDGSRKELIIIGREITHEKERQSRIKACFSAINSASDIIFILDATGNIFFINDMFVTEFGLDSYDAVVGKHVTETLNIPRFNAIWKKVSNNKTWEGTYNSAPMSIIPMMNGANHPIYYICTIKIK